MCKSELECQVTLLIITMVTLIAGVIILVTGVNGAAQAASDAGRAGNWDWEGLEWHAWVGGILTPLSAIGAFLSLFGVLYHCDRETDEQFRQRRARERMYEGMNERMNDVLDLPRVEDIVFVLTTEQTDGLNAVHDHLQASNLWSRDVSDTLNRFAVKFNHGRIALNQLEKLHRMVDEQSTPEEVYACLNDALRKPSVWPAGATGPAATVTQKGKTNLPLLSGKEIDCATLGVPHNAPWDDKVIKAAYQAKLQQDFQNHELYTAAYNALKDEARQSGAPRRRLGELVSPVGSSVALDVLPMVPSFIFMVILAGIVRRFWTRSNAAEKQSQGRAAAREEPRMVIIDIRSLNAAKRMV